MFPRARQLASRLGMAALLVWTSGCCHGIRGDIDLRLGGVAACGCGTPGCGGGCGHGGEGPPPPGHGPHGGRGLFGCRDKYKPAPRPIFQAVPLAPVWGPIDPSMQVGPFAHDPRMHDPRMHDPRMHAPANGQLPEAPPTYGPTPAGPPPQDYYDEPVPTTAPPLHPVPSAGDLLDDGWRRQRPKAVRVSLQTEAI